MRPERLRRVALILSIIALAPALALAQDGPTGRRMDPGVDPGDRTAGTELHAWSVVPVPGLPSGSILGTLWADPGGVFVWSTQTRILTPLGTQTPRLGDGDEPPDPGGGTPSTFVTTSTLLRYDGKAFSVELQLPGETAASVFGTDAKDVYAATNLENGEVRLYHFNGNRWRAESLPLDVRGPAGSIAGDRGRMFFRAGNTILLGQGRRWTVAYVNDRLVAGNEVVFLDRKHVVAPGDNGLAAWSGVSWTWQEAAQPVRVNGAWGARDLAGELHLFAAGSSMDETGPCIWQLREQTPGRLDLQQDVVLDEHTPPGLGAAIEVWGTGAHDQYAIGKANGCGCVYRFNGVAWTKLTPLADMPIPTGLSGTARGDVWIAFRNGSLLNGVRREPLAVEASEELEEPIAGLPTMGEVLVRNEAPGWHVLEFALPETRDVSVSVFSVAGRRIAQVGPVRLGAGAQHMRWNARGLPAGLYFCRVNAGSWAGTGKVLVGR